MEGEPKFTPGQKVLFMPTKSRYDAWERGYGGSIAVVLDRSDLPIIEFLTQRPWAAKRTAVNQDDLVAI